MLRLPWPHDHLSVMSAITAHCHLLSRTWTGAMNGPRVVAFLQQRLGRVPGKLRVIWDGALIHRCRAVKQCRADSFGKAWNRAQAQRASANRLAAR